MYTKHESCSITWIFIMFLYVDPESTLVCQSGRPKWHQIQSMGLFLVYLMGNEDWSSVTWVCTLKNFSQKPLVGLQGACYIYSFNHTHTQQLYLSTAKQGGNALGSIDSCVCLSVDLSVTGPWFTSMLQMTTGNPGKCEKSVECDQKHVTDNSLIMFGTCPFDTLLMLM